MTQLARAHTHGPTFDFIFEKPNPIDFTTRKDFFLSFFLFVLPTRQPDEVGCVTLAND